MNRSHAEYWVLGLGTSGEAVARLLCREGRSVCVMDQHADQAAAGRARSLADLGVDVRLGTAELPLGSPREAVVSPGLAADHAWLTTLRERGVPCRPEIEVAWERRRAPVVAITGSNGKTTAVTLLTHLLRAGGLHAVQAGNCGPPLSAVVTRDADWLVMEVSSFQLELAHRFRPDIGIVLNIQPNHLDRHPSMADYLWAKSRLFAAAEADDRCLVPDEWADRLRDVSGGGGRWVRFGSSLQADIRYQDGRVWMDGVPVADVRCSEFANPITGPMVAAVTACGGWLGLDPGTIELGVATFHGLPHRMETVGRVDGVRFVNDSKATSLSALRAAVLRADAPIRLIAGGVLKEANVRLPLDVFRDRVVSAYLIGAAGPTLQRAWSGEVACLDCGTLEAAFAAARRDATRGDTVLLSPGGASFDQFSSYRERGERFADMVANAGRLKPSTDRAGNPMDNYQAFARMTKSRNRTKEECA